MGLDNKVIFPEYQTIIMDKENPTATYTREANGIINRIDGRSKIENGLLVNVGILNSETNKYDINIITSKEYNFIELLTKTISIDQPLRQANNEVCDSIYKFTDGNYYLFKKVGSRNYQVGDEDNSSVITDGITTNYDLGRAGYTEVQLVGFDPNISFFGTTTTISCDSNMPSMEIQIPIDYAYNESKIKYNNENITIDTIDIDSRKKIDIVSIEGQTFKNLLQEPLENGQVVMPVNLEGREPVYTGGLNTTVPLTEIEGDTYINLLEDKIENATLKPSIRYNGDIFDGCNFTIDTSNITFNSLEEGSSDTISNWIDVMSDSIITIVIKFSAYWNVKGKTKEGNIVVLNPTVGGAGNTKSFVIDSTIVQIQLIGNNWKDDNVKSISGVMSNYILSTDDKIVIDEIQGNTVYRCASLVSSKQIVECILSSGLDNNAKVNDDNTFTVTFYGISNTFNADTKFIQLKANTKYKISCKDIKTSTYPSITVYDENGKKLSSEREFTTSSSGKILIYPGSAQGRSLTVIVAEKDFLENNKVGIWSDLNFNSVGDLYTDENNEPILDSDKNKQYKIDIICKNSNLFKLPNVNKTIDNMGTSNITILNNSIEITTTNANYHSFDILNGQINPYVITGKYEEEYGYSFKSRTLKKGTYILYFNVETSNEISTTFLTLRDINGRIVVSQNIYKDEIGRKTKEFTLSDDTDINYITIDLWYTVTVNLKIKDFMVIKKDIYTSSYIEPFHEIKSILLPQPLRGINNYKDRIYKNNNEYILEQKIGVINKELINSFTGNYQEVEKIFLVGNIWDKVDTGGINKREIIYSQSDKNIISQCADFGNPYLYIYINTENLLANGYSETSESVVQAIKENLYEIMFKKKEDSITKISNVSPITFKCYNNSMYLCIDKVMSELLVTTVPLFTNAYIKPNTKYTMFMNTNCEVNYNLGGLEGNYVETNKKVLLTTPSTLSNNTLSLLGEGNIGNVTLLEGDYTNSYVPEKFINDIFSVGDLQGDGSYKVDIVSKSLNNESIKSISLPCQLMKVGNVADRLYWDSSKGKMCIEKNIISINHAIEANGINLSYIGSGEGCGEVLYTLKGISDIKINSMVICNKFISFPNKYELLNLGKENGIEGVVANDEGNSTVVFSFKRSNVKTLDVKSIAQWFTDNNVVIKAYISSKPQIIETNITQPINIDVFDTNTTITTTSIVEPKIIMKLDALNRPVDINPSTKYYIHANVTGDVTVNLGGSEVNFASTDKIKEITTPNSIKENTISFTGNCNISNVMLRTDNRADIKYFNGEIYSSKNLVDGSFETTLNVTPIEGLEPTIVKFITTKPLKTNTSISHIGDTYKFITELGVQEDIIINGIIPTDNSFKIFEANGNVPAITSVIIPYRSIRPLKKPRNISFNNYLENDSHTFVWNTDVGVEGHKFYYKDNLIETINSPTPKFTYPEELEGDVKIIAFNTLTESEPLISNTVTLPNRTEIIDFEAKYVNNQYKMVVKFNDNSNIKKGYKFIYSIDNSENKILNIPITDNVVVLSQSISVPDIKDNIVVKINTYNDVGEVEISPKTFYLTPTPKWTYLTANNKLMFRIVDRFNFRANYNLLSSQVNALKTGETKEYMGSNEGNIGFLVDYLKNCDSQQEYEVSVVMDDETFTHIPCKPFNVSKNLDLSIVAPKNFTMEWLREGVAKFSWEDNYTNEERFEFNYSWNNGVEQNIIVQATNENKDENGKYFYVYNFAEHGSINAKVRMVWELNNSEYTESKQATFVEVTGLPPSWIIKKYNEAELIISWEAQSYVDHYEVKIECDGEIELLDIIYDMFSLDLTKYSGKYVSICIKTHFTTGVITEYSNSISFKPIINNGLLQEGTYSPIEVYKNNNVGIYTNIYDRYTAYQRIIGKVEKSFLVYLSSIKERLRHEGRLNSYFNSLIYEKYLDFVSIKTENVSSDAYLNVVNYANILIKELLNSLVYTPISSRFTDFLTIQRVTIVCIGDSITAG